MDELFVDYAIAVCDYLKIPPPQGVFGINTTLTILTGYNAVIKEVWEIYAIWTGCAVVSEIPFEWRKDMIATIIERIKRNGHEELSIEDGVFILEQTSRLAEFCNT